jgi:hypothetical protein
LSGGAYIVSMSDGRDAVTQKIIIE